MSGSLEMHGSGVILTILSRFHLVITILVSSSNQSVSASGGDTGWSGARPNANPKKEVRVIGNRNYSFGVVLYRQQAFEGSISIRKTYASDRRG